MKRLILSIVVLLITSTVVAQSPSKVANGIVIKEIISRYAQNSGEKILIDPRVKARVNLYGMPIEDIDFSALSTILKTHAFSWYRSGDLLVVVPTNIMKQQTVKLVEPGKEYAANEMVDVVIKMDKICPYTLMSVLRPLISPSSHLAPLDDPRVLIITDTYQNTQRIEKLVERLEAQQQKRQICPSLTER